MRIPTLDSYVRSPATQGANVVFKLAGSVGPEAPKRGAQEKARPRIQSQRSRPRAGTRRVIGTDDAHLRVWGAMGIILLDMESICCRLQQTTSVEYGAHGAQSCQLTESGGLGVGNIEIHTVPMGAHASNGVWTPVGLHGRGV